MTDRDAPFRWGFIGAGRIATSALAPAVHASDTAVLQAVAARDTDRARSLEPAGRVYGDYAALCADPDVDGVYISLPNSVHLEWTTKALAAGKHVLCEKPLCLDEPQTAQAFEAAADADRLLMEAFWYRWHPRTRRAEELVATGAIGDVTDVEAAFKFGGVAAGDIRLDPALGGGALYDVGCYTVTVAQWALGEVQVLDANARVDDRGVDLATTATLAGPTGTARISCSIDAERQDEIRVTGNGGSLEFRDGKGFLARRDDAVSLGIVDASGALRVEEFPAVDAYRLMAESFARVAAGADEFHHTRSDSLAVARTMDEIRALTSR